MEQAVAGVSVILWGMGVLGLFFGIVEHFAVCSMASWVFRIGPRVLFQPIEPVRLGRAGGRLDTRVARCRVLESGEALVTAKSSQFALHTSFPLKATIRESAGECLLEARAPLGSTVFAGSWVVLWFGFVPIGVLSGAPPRQMLGMAALGVAAVAGMALVSLPLEKKRLLQAVEELRRASGEESASPP